MTPDFHALDVLIDEAGSANSAQDTVAGADHALTKQVGTALSAIQAWSTAAQTAHKVAESAPPVAAGPGTGPAVPTLEPLSGLDLADMVRLQISGQYNQELAARLGERYTDYVNAYGPGSGSGWYDPTMMVLATNPAIRRTYRSPRAWALATGNYQALNLPDAWEGFAPTFAGGHTLPLP